VLLLIIYVILGNILIGAVAAVIAAVFVPKLSPAPVGP
jgi:hypothetical protein